MRRVVFKTKIVAVFLVTELMVNVIIGHLGLMDLCERRDVNSNFYTNICQLKLVST